MKLGSRLTDRASPGLRMRLLTVEQRAAATQHPQLPMASPFRRRALLSSSPITPPRVSPPTALRPLCFRLPRWGQTECLSTPPPAGTIKPHPCWPRRHSRGTSQMRPACTETLALRTLSRPRSTPLMTLGRRKCFSPIAGAVADSDGRYHA